MKLLTTIFMILGFLGANVWLWWQTRKQNRKTKRQVQRDTLDFLANFNAELRKKRRGQKSLQESI